MATVHVNFTIAISTEVAITPVSLEGSAYYDEDQVVSMVRDWFARDMAQSDAEWDWMILSAFVEEEARHVGGS
jgi:hypothetical protein